MSKSPTSARSLNLLFVIAGFIAAIVLLVNAAKRAEILALSPATQLVAPLAQLMALGLVVGIFAATPAIRGRLGSIGVLLYGASLVGLVGVEFIINLVFPYVTPEIIGELRAGPLGIALTVVSIAFLTGTLIFYSALWRVAQSPKLAIIISIVSSVPIALRTAFPEVVLQLGLVGLAVGVTLLSIWLFRSGRVRPQYHCAHSHGARATALALPPIHIDITSTKENRNEHISNRGGPRSGGSRHPQVLWSSGAARFDALAGVSLAIQPGESIAIVGKSGSGKSTLMHLLALLDEPDDGTLMVGDTNADELSVRRLNRLRNQDFGFVFQQFFLTPNATVLDNVVLPLKIAGVGARERKARGMAVLEQLEMADKAKSKAVNLSGGQKQRVVIARALVNNPKVIFADEPTGNLDTVTGALVEDILFTLNREQGITLVIVTHDPDLAARCDRQLFIRDGRAVRSLETQGATS